MYCIALHCIVNVVLGAIRIDSLRQILQFHLKCHNGVCFQNKQFQYQFDKHIVLESWYRFCIMIANS